jgi:hypothetical protein
MRKLALVGFVALGTGLFAGETPTLASAWCYGGPEYIHASPAQRFAYSPWGYRSCAQPYYGATSGWRGWGDRRWGSGGKRWGWGRRW